MSPADLENLKAIRRAVNRTAYHGGLGLRESGRYLSTLDRLLATFGVGPDDGPEQDPEQSIARRPAFPGLDPASAAAHRCTEQCSPCLGLHPEPR